ncbi:MAG: VWA domain-containing protein, partial [Planctomycetales bacterium]|nr:VWA domain-containing protein [Planctomycetales bacterium]
SEHDEPQPRATPADEDLAATSDPGEEPLARNRDLKLATHPASDASQTAVSPPRAKTSTQRRQRLSTNATPRTSSSEKPAREPAANAIVTIVEHSAPVGARRRRGRPGWMGSLVAHGALVAALAMQTFTAEVPPVDFELTTVSADLDDEIEILDELEIVPPEEFEQFDEQFAELPAVETLEAGAASLGDVSAAAALADVVGPGGLGETGFGDMGGLIDAGGAGLAGLDAGLGDAPLPAFFGHRIEGRRIVFVLDNSGSMQGGRLETVIAELTACVNALTPRQEFYVIFYSDAVYPLFYPQPAMQFVRPTDRNKRLLAEWLETVELCLGDTIDEALAAAASIGPDTVFLLSDGRIQSDKKLRFLLAAETRDFPIHTIGVGMGRSVAGREKLALVAEANGGTFLDRDVPAEMKKLALTSPRPYHNDSPGPVWGRNVKRGW